jgi:hypothetical protein
MNCPPERSKRVLELGREVGAKPGVDREPAKQPVESALAAGLCAAEGG